MIETVFYESGDARIAVSQHVFGCWHWFTATSGVWECGTRRTLESALEAATAMLLSPGAPSFTIARDQRTPLRGTP